MRSPQISLSFATQAFAPQAFAPKAADAPIARWVFAPLAAAFLAMALFVTPAMAGPDPDAESFIGKLADEVLTTLDDPNTTTEVRNEKFRKLFLDNTAIRVFGRSALGRYARLATEDELQTYYGLLEDYAVQIMQLRLKDYTAGTKFVVTGSELQERPKVSRAFVESDVIGADGEKKAAVRWVLLKSATSPYKIYDISVMTPSEGGTFSLLETQRSEFDAVISNNGRKISALLDFLRQQIDKTKSEIQAG